MHIKQSVYEYKISCSFFFPTAQMHVFHLFNCYYLLKQYKYIGGKTAQHCQVMWEKIIKTKRIKTARALRCVKQKIESKDWCDVRSCCCLPALISVSCWDRAPERSAAQIAGRWGKSTRSWFMGWEERSWWLISATPRSRCRKWRCDSWRKRSRRNFLRPQVTKRSSKGNLTRWWQH